MTSLPFPDSQCHRCRHHRITGNTRGSVFIQCRHPDLPKYRSQPVTGCDAFAHRGEVSGCDTPGAAADVGSAPDDSGADC